ncbi:MAG TPA: cytochrome c biogenesis protein CcsA [Solirubrobacteraceae bacterium]|nr:cytochrome c biogenesis protein CcsA [Solirubrobacteraceae bacterium]
MKTYGRGLRGLSLVTVLTITVAFALVFFYAPLDANQGFIQKIFYIHVPLAITALCGFVFGGVLGAMYLRTGERKWDIRSYVAIHMALIFGIGTLFTGTIWAKASWGHWWVWSDPTLTSFLIVMLLFATYQPLRFSIEDPERQSRYASVFAVVAGAFVPLNFIAVRLAQPYVHPRVLTLTGGNLPGPMRLTFVVALLGVALLYVTLWKYEMAAKSTRMRVRALRRTLLTGTIWAKASWGHWWVWSDPTLTSFLIVMLLFATYQPLRFSIEDPARQSVVASVFAVTCGAFVPLNFVAVRLASPYLHPRVLG